MALQCIKGDFKQAMRRLASTISIVTSGTGDAWTGMAATAVTSVTADPPTILIAINHNASIFPVILEHRQFCLNLLGERHRELVAIFSGVEKGLTRFEAGNWEASDEGLPVLCDALANLICYTSDILQVRTHTLFIAEVQKIRNHPSLDPLIWIDGKFAAARPLV